MVPMTDTANPGKRVLIAEDVASVGDLVRMVLEASGYVADVVADGARAVAAAASVRYDLILMDIEMPVMDGYAASRAIRDLPTDRAGVPVLALTARRDHDEAERCRRAGMDGYLSKPFDPAALVKAIAPWAANGRRSGTLSCTAGIWDSATYRELADRLGPVRMRTALQMFEQHLVRSLSVVLAHSQELVVLTEEAHGLVSISGMLGFTELSAASRQLMTSQTPVDAAAAVAELRPAAERVLIQVRKEAEAVST